MKPNNLFVGIVLLALALPRMCFGYIEAAYTLGRVISESTNILVMRVEKVDRESNRIIYRKIADIKGHHPTDLIKHNIGNEGFSAREWQIIMKETEVGKIAVMFHNGSASETCINNYWYQCYPGGDWWKLVHGEPYLLRTYYGKPENLIPAVQEIMAGKEVVVTAMADGDKNALSIRAAKIQYMRTSLKLMEYNERRDFAGWGPQEFQHIDSMPGFTRMGMLNRVDPGAMGIAPADFDGSGYMGLCVYGESKVMVLRPNGNRLDEITMPYTGGARAAAWGDINGDGKPDLLLATPYGPRLFVNTGSGFADASAMLPVEPYYNLTAAAFINGEADGRQDILLANGFLGLRLYRNTRVAAAATQPAAPPATQPATQPAFVAGSGPKWFEDVSAKVGLGPNGIGSMVKGDHLVVADVNGDGRMDFLYSAGRGVLVLNTPQGFVEAKDSGISFVAGNVAPAFGAFAGDKAQHLFVPQLAGACKLFRNDGKGHFTDVTAQAGDLAKPIPGATCALWIDMKKTGKPDLMVGCLRGPNRFFRNQGNGAFVDAGDEIGFYQRIYNTRAMCVFDMNKDGVPDIAFNNEGQDPVVLLGAQ